MARSARRFERMQFQPTALIGASGGFRVAVGAYRHGDEPKVAMAVIPDLEEDVIPISPDEADRLAAELTALAANARRLAARPLRALA